MADRKTKSRNKTALRRRAEERLQGQEEALAELTPAEIRRLVHELRVQQVELEIQNDELRQTQISLEEARSRYSDLYDFAPVSYFTLDDNGRILEANLTAASLLGVESGGLIGKKFLQFVARGDMGVFNRFLPQILESRASCEVRLKGRSGELAARLDGLLRRDAEGRTRCRVTATDISDLRGVENELRQHRDHLEQLVLQRTDSLRAQTLKLEVQREELLRVTDELERERARLRTTLEQMPEGIVIAEAHSGKLLLVNRKMSTIFGRLLSSDDGLEFIAQFQASHPDGRPLGRGEWPLTQALAMGQAVAGEEIEVLGGDGVRRSLWVSAAPVRDRLGRTIAVVATYQDITALKIAETEIRRMASFPRLNVNPVLEIDLTGAITFCNQAAFTVLQSGDGTAWPEAFFPEDLEYILSAAPEQAEAIFYREVRVKDAVYAEDIAYVEPFKVIRIYATDITARKRFEEALRTTNAQLSALIENSPLAIMQLDEEGTILSCNPAGERMLGWSAAELVGQKIPMVPPVEMKIVKEVLRRVSQGERFIGIERRRLRKDGSLIDLSVSVAPMYDEAGRFTGIVNLMEDITPRKEAEAALRESQEHYRSLFNNMLNGYAYCQMHFEQARPVDFTYLEVNGAFEDLTGLKNVVGKKVSEVIPGIRESDPELLEIYGRVALTGKPERFETYVESLKMWFAISVYSSRREYFVALFEVISERKRAEEALRRSKEEWERTFDAVPDLIAILDEHHRIVRANRSMAKVLGAKPEDLIGRACYEVMHHSSGPLPICPHSQLLCDGQEHIEELRELGRDLLVSASPLRNGQGNLIGSVHVARDITERKAAEEALRRAHDELEQRVRERTADLRRTVEQLQFEIEERLVAEEMLRQSEARFRSAFDQSPVGAAIVDHNLGIQRVNLALCQIIGYSAEELATMNVADFCHPDDQPQNLDIARRFLTGEMDQARVEERNIRKDGTVIWIDLSVSAINPGDRPGYFLGIVQDITARKAAEKALARHAAMVRDLYDNAPCGYHSLDPEGRFVQVNHTELTWLGYTREEMLGGMLFADLLTPASREIFLNNFPGFKARGWASDLEFEVFRKDGTILPVLLNATAVTDDAGHYVMSRSTMVDITERRRSQAALEAERRRFFDMLEKIPAYVALIGPDCTIPYANREFVRRFGDPENRLCYEFLFGLDEPCDGCKALEVFKTRTPQIWEWTGPDGHNYQIHDHPFTDADGSPLILELGVDISGLKAAEADILRQSAILSAINRVFREFLSCKTEEELGRTCLTVAEELTGSAFGLIGEVNQAGHLDLTAFSDPGWAACRMGEPGQERVKLLNLGMRGLKERVINEGCAVIVNDPVTHPEAAGLPPGHPPLTSYLGVPLRYGSKVIGLIALANKAGGFTQDDQKALESLSVAIIEGLMRFRAETRVAIVNRLYLFLSQVNEAIVRIQDQTVLFQEICRIAVEEGRFKMAWVGIVDAQGDAVKAVAQYGLEEGYLERIIISCQEGPESHGPTGTAIREDRSDICNDIANDQRMAPWREEALRRGYRSSGAFPLRVNNHVVGSLTTYAAEPEFFTGEEVRLLESLANDVAFAMESLERDALRRQTEAALQESEGRLRYLAAQLIDSQEKERNRIALDLHDDLGQSLMVLTMHLRAIAQMVPSDQGKIRDQCNQTLSYVYEIIENVRRLSRDLRPSLLEDLGLAAALRHLAETFRSYHGIDVSLEMDDIRGLFAPHEEINIYRIFQESLTNVAKYAQATQVSFTIRKLAGRVSFRVEDNGRGFAMDRIFDKNTPRKGLGLVAMEERVRMMGGSLEIWSQEGRGTWINFMLPMRT